VWDLSYKKWQLNEFTWKFFSFYSAWILAGGGVSEPGGRAYLARGSGEGWVFIDLGLQCDRVICAYVGGED